MSLLERNWDPMSLEAKKERMNQELLSLTQKLDPSLVGLYWNFFSGVYAELDGDTGHEGRIEVAHSTAMNYTLRVREELNSEGPQQTSGQVCEPTGPSNDDGSTGPDPEQD